MKLKLVDPVRSMIARLQMQHQPRSPYFRRGPNSGFQKGRNYNPHGVGAALPGEKGRNPRCGENLKTPAAQKARFLNGIRRAATMKGGRFMKNKTPKPKKPGKRSPESLKIATDFKQIQDMAKQFAPECMKALASVVTSDVSSDLAKISASQAILDRAYGKALQTSVSATVNGNGEAKDLDAAELDRRVAAAVTRVESLASRKREKIKSPEQPANLRKLH